MDAITRATVLDWGPSLVGWKYSWGELIGQLWYSDSTSTPTYFTSSTIRGRTVGWHSTPPGPVPATIYDFCLHCFGFSFSGSSPPILTARFPRSLSSSFFCFYSAAVVFLCQSKAFVVPPTLISKDGEEAILPKEEAFMLPDEFHPTRLPVMVEKVRRFFLSKWQHGPWQPSV